MKGNLWRCPDDPSRWWRKGVQSGKLLQGAKVPDSQCKTTIKCNISITDFLSSLAMQGNSALRSRGCCHCEVGTPAMPSWERKFATVEENTWNVRSPWTTCTACLAWNLWSLLRLCCYCLRSERPDSLRCLHLQRRTWWEKGIFKKVCEFWFCVNRNMETVLSAAKFYSGRSSQTNIKSDTAIPTGVGCVRELDGAKHRQFGKHPRSSGESNISWQTNTKQSSFLHEEGCRSGELVLIKMFPALWDADLVSLFSRGNREVFRKTTWKGSDDTGRGKRPVGARVSRVWSVLDAIQV